MQKYIKHGVAFELKTSNAKNLKLLYTIMEVWRQKREIALKVARETKQNNRDIIRHFDVQRQNLLSLHRAKEYRFTIVGMLDDTKTSLSIGLSICSYKDQFARSIGVNGAGKRALENPIYVHTLATAGSSIEIDKVLHKIKILVQKDLKGYKSNDSISCLM